MFNRSLSKLQLMGDLNDSHTKTKTIGNLGELNACTFLEKKGFILVKKNYCKKGGEIDLIMRDGEYYVFIEVKHRQHNRYGHPIEMISSTKQRRIIQTATHYLQTHFLSETALCRFDVVGITASDQSIVWIKNAFEVQ